MNLDTLNPMQQEAVRATEGRVRVIAGAGSGKTRVLAYRYAYLVNEAGIDPSNILCLTFTNKAAQEMRSRIARLTAAGNVNDFVCTIHGFCVKFLREEIHRLGYPKTFQILDEEDMESLAKEVLADNGIKREEKTVKELLKEFARWKRVNDYIGGFLLTSSQKGLVEQKELSLQLLLKQHRYLALDFDDLLFFTLYILNTNEEVRNTWQRRMNYIMVDEVQDCSKTEWDIFETLSMRHNNLFIVGDPDQSIYEWRGAVIDLFIDFNSDQDIFLNRNYRSTSIILDAANSIIANNAIRIKKDLYTLSNPGAVITHFHGKSEDEESNWTADQIQRIVDGGGSYADVAILIRASYLSRSIEQAFLRKDIPYTIWGGVRFFERKEIKDALSYLRLIALNDDISFKRIANVPSRKIGDVTMEKIAGIAESRGCSMFEALKEYQASLDKPSESIGQFIHVIEHLRKQQKELPISELLRTAMLESGLWELYRDDTEEGRLENLNELCQSVKTYEDDNRENEISVETYLQDIALYTNADYSKEKNQVKIMTIHQAKGLEFPVVFIAGLSEGIFPNRRSIRERKKRGMEEERRLMYVAVTRAEKALYLTESEGFTVHGDFSKYPSRFLREIQQNLFVTEGVITDEIWAQADAFKGVLDLDLEDKSYTLEERKPGTEVVHAIFGDGVVKELNDDGVFCEVEFASGGTRFIRLDKLTLKNKVEAVASEDTDSLPDNMKRLELLIAVKSKESLPN